MYPMDCLAYGSTVSRKGLKVASDGFPLGWSRGWSVWNNRGTGNMSPIILLSVLSQLQVSANLGRSGFGLSHLVVSPQTSLQTNDI